MRRPPIDREFVRFLGVGAFNTASGYFYYWALLHVVPYVAAYTISYTIGIVISYLLNCRFVFRSAPSWRGVMRFPLVYVVQFALGLSLLAVFVERLHWDKRVAAIAVVCCSVPFTFLLSRWIIRAPEGPSTATSPSNEN